jgi:tetratricopeptide (TPR) repeat protein
VTWQEYFFTQCRVIWTYIRLYVLPLGQNIDPEVPLSRGLLDHGAVFGLAALAALAGSAWIWRKREPLASFGVFWFLILLAPTSSIVPILDPLAERRMYLPILGLILITIALARRWGAGRAAATGVLSLVLVLAALFTFQRNQVWAGSIPLWADAAAKSPLKVRPRFQLAFSYYEAGRCPEAVREFEAASKLGPPSHELLVDWGLSLDCAGRYEDAVDRIERAAKLEPTAHVYAVLGMVHGKRGKTEAALQALAQAEKIDRNYDMIYAYRGNVYLGANQLELAAAEFRRALALNPSNPMAAQGLQLAGQRMRAPR